MVTVVVCNDCVLHQFSRILLISHQNQRYAVLEKSFRVAFTLFRLVPHIGLLYLFIFG